MPQENKKIGFLGGTFDPLHLGHIHLALALQERWGLSEVWFNPASCSPFKTSKPPLANFEQRYQMLLLALKKYPGFRVLDLERGSTVPVYTIDAIVAFMKQSKVKSEDLYLLLGDDALVHFNQWKEAKQLALLAHPLIGTRRHVPSLEELLQPFESDPVLHARFKKGLTLMPLLEISSTAIRERIQKGLPCEHLIPEEVSRYIREENLYKETQEEHQHFEKQTIWL